MPIIEPPGDPKAPLSQGHVLRGVQLFVTKGVTADASGESQLSRDSLLCLVLSRPCVALRDEYLTVASIEKYKQKPPASFASLEVAKAFYADVRDGLSSPDQFYLGRIPGIDALLCARLDSLHTIRIPTDAAAREAFIAKARVARLSKDFAHDLHARLFRAYASLGFDDHNWYSTEDLKVIVAVGERDAGVAQGKLNEAKAKLALARSQGVQHKSAQDKAEQEEAEHSKEVSELNAVLQPFRDALASRSTLAPPPDGAKTA